MAETFGGYLRYRREALGLTKSELAARSGVTHTSILRLETNAYKRPSIENIQALATALGAPLDEALVAAGYPARPMLRPQPYFRTAYGLSPEAAAEADKYIREHYGVGSDPLAGEDETEDFH